MARAGIELNGVRYRWPSRPVVVVCIDGGDPAYFDRGVRDGVVPNVARFMKTGFAAVADGDVPSFTCPNNMSITTGSPPAVHGISGNFYLDRETGEAVVMTGPDLLRSRTIMAAFSSHGATVALTADHGMNDKSNPDGSPNVIWLQDVLDARFGKGACTVVCPITDRFVAHHGALGGFVRVYCRASLDPADVMKVARAIPGVETVCDRATAARRFELPLDREGDVAVISQADTCIGASEKDHDLSGLRGHRLRTHGGISEAKVPFILNRPLRAEYAARAAAGPLRSYQIFDFAINGVE